MPDLVTYELYTRLFDSSLEMVAVVGDAYKIRVSSVLQSAIAAATANIADHETRIDALEAAAGGGDITAVTTGATSGLAGGATSGAVDLSIVRGTAVNTTRHGNDAAYTDARVPSGAAGGQVGGTFPSSLDVRGIRETSGPTALTIGAVANGEYLKRVGSTLVGGTPSVAATFSSEPYAKPTVADSRDDEFETTTLDSAWKIWDITGVTSATPTKAALAYSVPASNRYQCHTDRKPSWFSLQCTHPTQFLLKPTTMTTNDCLWARMAAFYRYSTGGSAANMYFVIMAATGGHPDPNNRVLIGFSQTGDSSQIITAARFVAGVGTVIPSTESGSLNPFSRGVFPYMVIEKVGTTFKVFAHGSAGTKDYQTTTISWTPAYVGFECQNNASNVDGDIFQADFVRGNVNGFLSLPL